MTWVIALGENLKANLEKPGEIYGQRRGQESPRRLKAFKTRTAHEHPDGTGETVPFAK